MDNTPSGCSAVRCRVFKELRGTTDRAWEADALPTELFPLLLLRSKMIPDGHLDAQSPAGVERLSPLFTITSKSGGSPKASPDLVCTWSGSPRRDARLLTEAVQTVRDIAGRTKRAPRSPPRIGNINGSDDSGGVGFTRPVYAGTVRTSAICQTSPTEPASNAGSLPGDLNFPFQLLGPVQEHVELRGPQLRRALDHDEALAIGK